MTGIYSCSYPGNGNLFHKKEKQRQEVHRKTAAVRRQVLAGILK